ncbi:MAG: hypothetical protein AAEJ53_04270 [Myxococcota bacterium]
MIRRVGLGFLCLGLACAGPSPVVVHNTHAKTEGLFRNVAVFPFAEGARLSLSLEPGGVSPGEAAALVSRFVVESLGDEGIRVISPADVEVAFESLGRQAPRADAVLAARVAARKFGASAVVMGEVQRYRERVGKALGAQRPASVGFGFALYSAPTGQRIWSARFDETQQTFSGAPLRAYRYPGAGTRWLSAAELARWGAAQALSAVPASVR